MNMNFAKRLIGREMSEGAIFLFRFGIDQDRMTLIEGAPLGILAS